MPDSFQPPSDPGEVLSQSEVERLLADLHSDESSIEVIGHHGLRTRKSKDALQPCDFRNPIFLSPSELRKLRLRHERFIQTLAAKLSMFLRLDFSLQMSQLQTIPYQKLIDSLPNPSQITAFKVEPLSGIGLLDLHPRLALTVVDRLLGGPALASSSNRNFTEIESALLEQIVQLILGEWCAHWAEVQELRAVVLGRETNPRFLTTSAPGAIMLLLAMDARLNDCSESLQIALPYYSLEPLVRKLKQELETPPPLSAPAPVPPWKPLLNDLPIRVTASWNQLELTASEFSRLEPGQILELHPHSSLQVQLLLEGRPKFVGRLGRCGDRWAIEIHQRIAQ